MFGAAAWSVYFGLEVNWICLAVVFMLTFSIYQYNRLTDEAEDNINDPDSLALAKKNASLIQHLFFYTLSIISLLVAAGYGWKVWLAVILIEAIGYSYNEKCFPDFLVRLTKGKRRLKEFFIIKNIAPSIDWATAMVLLPLLFDNEDLTLKAWLCWAYTFAAAFFIEVMWDIRDRQGDLKSGIKTIANTRTLHATKKLIVGLSVIVGVSLAVLTFSEVLPTPSYFLISNNLAVIVIANLYHDDSPQSGQWLSQMTVVLAMLLFASFGAIAYFSQ
jgi:4-hydroxybenzoate polyprenyltransferase